MIPDSSLSFFISEASETNLHGFRFRGNWLLEYALECGEGLCHGVHGGARNEDTRNFVKHFIVKQHGDHRDRWSTGTHIKGMTLRLDTDAGKHRVLKGGTKLGN